MRMKFFVIASMTLCGLVAQAEQGTRGYFNGIVCEGVEASPSGVPAYLLIKEISETTATLSLDLDGTGLPDFRPATIYAVQNDGQVGHVYVANPGAFNRSRFQVATDGTTPQNTTEATLTFEDSPSEIEMTCWDGMTDAE